MIEKIYSLIERSVMFFAAFVLGVFVLLFLTLPFSYKNGHFIVFGIAPLLVGLAYFLSIERNKIFQKTYSDWYIGSAIIGFLCGSCGWFIYGAGLQIELIIFSGSLLMMLIGAIAFYRGGWCWLAFFPITLWFGYSWLLFLLTRLMARGGIGP